MRELINKWFDENKHPSDRCEIISHYADEVAEFIEWHNKSTHEQEPMTRAQAEKLFNIKLVD